MTPGDNASPGSIHGPGKKATQAHSRVAFLPFVRVTLKASQHQAPKTLGEHLKQRRLERKLTQKEAGERLGVSEFTVINWEKSKTEPGVECMPAILQFLGYDPFPEPITLSERLLTKRRQMGWTIAEAARQIGVDEGTWGGWEASGVIRSTRCQTMVDLILAPRPRV